MPEREMHLVEPAVRFIDAVLGLILGDLRVRIGGEECRENHLVGIRTSHWERVTHDRPLRLTIKRSEEHTSELQSRLHLVCRLLLEKKKQTRMRCTQLR